MLEQEFHVLTEIGQGKIVGGRKWLKYRFWGGMGFGGPGGDPLSSAQMDFVKTAEGYVDHVYSDQYGNLTVGYGHVLTQDEKSAYLADPT